MIKKLIMLLFLTLFLINNVSAIDNTWYSPSCVTPSYDSGYDLVWTNNNGSSTGSIAFVSLNSAGTVLSGNFRLVNGTDILCGISSRTTENAGITRVFGTSEDGSVFYFDNNLVDYSLGFYTISPATFTCSGSGGNCNPIHKIASLSATTGNRRIIEDSSGNLYIADGSAIYKFTKSTGYTQTTLYTISHPTDYGTDDGNPGAYTAYILDLGIDASQNIQILIGTSNTGVNGGVTYTGYISRSVITLSGVHSYTDSKIYSHTIFQDYAGFRQGTLLSDAVNSTYNMTLAIEIFKTSVVSVYHYAHTGGSTTIVSPVVGATNVYAMGYSGLLYYVPYLTSNIIRSYSTAYTGYVPSSEFVGTTELTYATRTITSLDLTYYNKSSIYLEYNVIIDSLDSANLAFLSDFSDYRWSIALTDPNGVSQTIVQSPKCMYDGILDSTCQISSTMGINAPPNGWLAGSWIAKLYEINIVTQNRALIATSSAFTVLNTSLENQSIAPPPFEPITSGTAATTISKIDEMLNFFGFGVNAVSKLLFSMVIIAIFLIVGLIYGNGSIAMVLAFVPYAFFTFIEYIPKWIFIITIILLAIASKVFR